MRKMLKAILVVKKCEKQKSSDKFQSTEIGNLISSNNKFVYVTNHESKFVILQIFFFQTENGISNELFHFTVFKGRYRK